MHTKRRIRHIFWILPLIVLIFLLLYKSGFFVDPYSGENATITAYAKKHRIPYSEYPESLIDLLERNPETESFVLEYPMKHSLENTVDLSEYRSSESVPLFMQWDQRWGYIPYGSDVAGLTGCGPVCLSMAAFYLTGSNDFSPDHIIRFAIENDYVSVGNGSSWTLISEGGEKLGFDITEIPLDKNRIVRNLEVDNPIICVMGPGDFTTSGHYIVLCGYENGLFRFNDPNSIANSQKLWDYEEIKDQIRNIWVVRNIPPR